MKTIKQLFFELVPALGLTIEDKKGWICFGFNYLDVLYAKKQIGTSLESYLYIVFAPMFIRAGYRAENGDAIAIFKGNFPVPCETTKEITEQVNPEDVPCYIWKQDTTAVSVDWNDGNWRTIPLKGDHTSVALNEEEFSLGAIQFSLDVIKSARQII